MKGFNISITGKVVLSDKEWEDWSEFSELKKQEDIAEAKEQLRAELEDLDMSDVTVDFTPLADDTLLPVGTEVFAVGVSWSNRFDHLVGKRGVVIRTDSGRTEMPYLVDFTGETDYWMGREDVVEYVG